MAKETKKKVKKMKDNTNKKDNKKEKRHFFKDVKAELKKVIWPTPKQLVNNTLAVIVSVLIVGVIVFVLDICFEKINSFGIEKLKTVVQSSKNEETNTTTDDSETNSTTDETTTDESTEVTTDTTAEGESATEENSADSTEGSSEESTESTDNAE